MESIAPFFVHTKKIVPVIALPALDMALPLADTLAACGFSVLEITLRTDCALDAIRQIARERPGIKVGAGTVKNVTQMQAAEDAGAQFIVSPGLDLAMVNKARSARLPLVPGIMTATELMQAENEGLPVVKLFPATLAGGTDFIDAMKPVFPGMLFFPTGGINEESAAEFLMRDNVLCIGGSWLTPTRLMQQRDWPKIHEVASRS